MKISRFLISLILLLPVSAHAGIYTDDLSRCLVEKTSAQDKEVLVKWIFAMVSRHPSVSDIGNVSEDKLDQLNRTTADLMMRLMTESCHEPMAKAMQYEGGVAIQESFQVLGKVAAGALFANPQVSQAMTGIQKYLDIDKLQRTFGAQ